MITKKGVSFWDGLFLSIFRGELLASGKVYVFFISIAPIVFFWVEAENPQVLKVEIPMKWVFVGW